MKHKNFICEFGRVFDRIPFIQLHEGELTLGYGRYALHVGKWFAYID